MQSPFPGMDPYLEAPAVWEEFHHVFLTECKYYLARTLPPGYVARIGERVGIIGLTDEAAPQYVPDVALAKMRGHRSLGDVGTGRPVAVQQHGAVALAEPLTLEDVEDIEVREGYIEVIRVPDSELVTVIELLSPRNKSGEGLGEYHAKRRALIARGVHVVEIDLLRRGRRTALARPLPPADYCVLVFPADRRPQVDVYPFRLRDTFPVIPVPLRAPDPPAPLELAAVFANAYDRGRLDQSARYEDGPPPGLSAADAAWAAELARRMAR